MPPKGLENQLEHLLVLIYLLIYCFTGQVLKVGRTPGPTACSKTKKLHNMCLKS